MRPVHRRQPWDRRKRHRELGFDRKIGVAMP
jgi:hypothetical protein